MGSQSCSMCCKSDINNQHEVVQVIENETYNQQDQAYSRSYQKELQMKMFAEEQQGALPYAQTRFNLETEEEQRVCQLDQVVNQVHQLGLLVLSSPTLDKGMVFRVNAQGGIDSYRKAKDGYVYFGCKKRQNGQIVNDFIIPLEDKSIWRQHVGQHFMIFYDLKKSCYMISDLAVGFGTFYKLDGQLVLKDNQLINIGEVYLVVNLNQEKGISSLRVKLFGGSVQGKTIYFTADSVIDTTLLIGRMNTCQIHIQDQLLSKIHANIQFSRSKGWILQDGDPIGCRRSTNSTWIYLSEPFEIYDKMIFKSSQTLLQANFC